MHSFWCFAFERYNGILGSMPNNNRSIEVQLMRRFLQENQVLTLPFDIEGDEFATKLFPLFPKKVQCVSVSYKYTFIFRGRMPSAVVCFSSIEKECELPKYHH